MSFQTESYANTAKTILSNLAKKEHERDITVKMPKKQESSFKA